MYRMGAFMFFRAFALLGVLICVGCTQKVVENIAAANQIEGRTDGAVIGYYLPEAIWKFTVQFDASTGLISIMPDAQPTIVPDTTRQYWLSYAHAGLSDDTIDIQLDNSMLSLVSSTTFDQSVKIIEAANTLISQVGSTKTALQSGGEKAAFALAANDPITLAHCTTNLKSEIRVNVSTLKRGRQHDLQWAENCSLVVAVKAERQPLALYKANVNLGNEFQESQDLSTRDHVCDHAICFRPSQVVSVGLHVALYSNFVGADGLPLKDKDGKPSTVKGDHSYPVRLFKASEGKAVPLSFSQWTPPITVPAANAGMAFVEFGRRAFVLNATSIAFKNGVVSEFKTTDPSIIAGALTLSSDLLKTVVLTIPIVK
jgi:hypothetical protein